MKRQVSYQGDVYTLKRNAPDAPDLGAMSSLGARVWLLKHTVRKGPIGRADPYLKGLRIRDTPPA